MIKRYIYEEKNVTKQNDLIHIYMLIHRYINRKMSKRHAILLLFSVSRNDFLSSIGSSFSEMNMYYFYKKKTF